MNNTLCTAYEFTVQTEQAMDKAESMKPGRIMWQQMVNITSVGQ